MKRSGFKPRTKPMNRGTSQLQRSAMKPAKKPMAAVGQRAKRMRQGKVAPNAIEQAWMDAIAGFGCIVCWLQLRAKTPAAVHHLVAGSRRIGHLWTIPLCEPGHHQGSSTPLKISRHPDKARFESAYGTELFLLSATREIIGKQNPQLVASLPPLQ